MPNPSVGAVLVLNEKIIGEGYTSPYGGPHAEVNAINSVKSEAFLKKATLYVSLEPCIHFGKTPPCTDLIIRKGIKNIVIGCVDPFSEVAGKGIKKLKESGCHVTVGVLKNECEDLNKRFFTFHTKKRPFIILKWAQSNDGFIGVYNHDATISDAKPLWITNKNSRQLVHKWRAEEQGILVGTNTVMNDNPELNTRNWHGSNPVRIILDPNLRILNTYAVHDGTATTIIITDLHQKIKPTENSNYEQIDFSKSVASQLCTILYEHQIQSVIVEGGARTLQTFIDESLWDEARIFIGQGSLEYGVKAPKIKGTLDSEEFIINDHLKIIRNS